MFYKKIDFKEDSRYIFEASLANNMRLHLFTLSDYERMLDMDIDGIYSLLNEKRFDISIKKIDDVINKSKRALLDVVLKFSKEEALREYFIFPFDFINLKTIYKGWLKEEKFENLKFISNGSIQIEKLNALYEGEETGVLHEVFAKSLKKFDNDIKDRTPFEVDIIWDKYLHQFYLEKSKELENDFMIKVHSLRIDLKNMLNLFRLKSFDKDYRTYERCFIPGGQLSLYSLSGLYKEEMDVIIGKLSYLDYHNEMKKGLDDFRRNENLSGLERELEKFLMKYINQAANRIFNFDVIVAYYWLKEIEINNLRLLLTAKTNSIDKNWILSKLRVIDNG